MMIRKLRHDRRVRAITRSLVRLHIDLTWIDEPLFMRKRIDEPSSSVSHITDRFSSLDHQGRLWHKWGFVGDARLLTLFLQDHLSHESEEQFAQDVHDLACKMIKKGYLEYAPNMPSDSTYEGDISDVGRIRVTHRNTGSVTGKFLKLSQKAYSLPSNDPLQFMAVLLSNAMPLTLVLLTVLQVMEIARNLGVIDFVRGLLP